MQIAKNLVTGEPSWDQWIENEIYVWSHSRAVGVFRRYPNGELRFWNYAKSVEEAVVASKRYPTMINPPPRLAGFFLREEVMENEAYKPTYDPGEKFVEAARFLAEIPLSSEMPGYQSDSLTDDLIRLARRWWKREKRCRGLTKVLS